MSAATNEPLRLVPSVSEPAPGPARRVLLLAAAGVAVAAAVAIAALSSSGPRGLRALPAEERAALLGHTLDELRQYCGAGRPAALDDHCRELASFAARFDECRGECERLVRPLLTPTPTR